MRLWPIILDARPAYLLESGSGASLLELPLGTGSVLEHLTAWLKPITNNPPVVLAQADSTHQPGHAERLRALCPTVQVVYGPSQVVDALAGHEPSDALLILDPTCLPVQEFEIAALVQRYVGEPRIAHHLVAFERGGTGTKERVKFDATGRVTRIARHYESDTWPFIAAVSATILPVACGVVSDGLIPASLTELRQILARRAVPGRDVPID